MVMRTQILVYRVSLLVAFGAAGVSTQASPPPPVTEARMAAIDAPSHHTSEFFVDDCALRVGVRALTAVALDYLQKHGTHGASPQ
jgi:metal-dependent amidase/aminoacylase/carboxypeptidase family protein